MIRFTWITSFPATVGASDKSARLFGDVLPWLILLVGLIVVGGVLIFVFRRWMDHESPTASTGFSFQDFRAMHARGELSDEQFQAAKATMIGRLAEKPSSASTAKVIGLSDLEKPLPNNPPDK